MNNLSTKSENSDIISYPILNRTSKKIPNIQTETVSEEDKPLQQEEEKEDAHHLVPQSENKEESTEESTEKSTEESTEKSIEESTEVSSEKSTEVSTEESSEESREYKIPDIVITPPGPVDEEAGEEVRDIVIAINPTGLVGSEEESTSGRSTEVEDASGNVMVVVNSESIETEEKSPAQLETASSVAEDQSQPEKITGLKFALVYFGLSITFFLAALDLTIVATTTNAIGNEFQAYTQISWVGTAYLLCSAGFGPSWGRLSDVFGRKITFLTAIFLFEVGSAICGAAPNIIVLIVGRGVAGLGGGGIVSLTLIIITDIVSIREAGKYSGILGAVFGLSSVIGPLLGGAFTDHITWRWAFYINLPLGGVAALIVFLFLNLPHTSGSMLKKLKRVDYVGSATVMLSIILILLGIQWGGSTYPWDSPQVIGFIVAGIVMFIVFIFVEGCLAKQPIMPLKLFKNRTVIGTLIASVFYGGNFFGLIYFSPIFFQIVFGESATNAGLRMLPLILSVVIVASISGIVISKTGIYRPLMIGGMAIAAVGCGLIITWNPSINDGQKIGYLFLTGFGLGWNLQNIVLVGQNAVDTKEIAVVTATSVFFRTLGGTAIIAIMQSVFNTKLQNNLEAYASQIPFPVESLQSQPSLMAEIAEPLKTEIIDAFSNAITTSYYVTMAMAIAATLALFLMENRPLRTDRGVASPE